MNPLDHIYVVLYRPENPTNIGAVVRAMRNMGILHLRLVQPVPYTRDELLRLAHRCDVVVDEIRQFATLDEALSDAALVIGTAAINHAGVRIERDVRKLAADAVELATREPVALLFGPEADGLDRYALDRCHLIAALPTDPAYPALNLAQAVLLFLYEVRLAAAEPVPVRESRPRAAQEQLERLFESAEAALNSIGFFKYNPAAVMHALRQIAYRAELSPEEAALLLAIARRVERGSPEPRPIESSLSD